MPVRPAMADLIAEVRLKVGDPSGPDEDFSDQEIQDALDRNRTWQNLIELDTIFDYATSRYGIFNGPTHWEAVTFYDRNYAIVAAPAGGASEVDLAGGRFVFDPQRIEPDLFATGWTYDVNGAAATVLDWWIARLKSQVDVSVGGDSFALSQQIENLEAIRASVIQGSAGAMIQSRSVTRSDWKGGRRRATF